MPTVSALLRLNCQPFFQSPMTWKVVASEELSPVEVKPVKARPLGSM